MTTPQPKRQLELVEIAWRVLSPRGGTITTCALYRVAGRGVEVRSYHGGEDDLLGSHRVVDIRTARQLAGEWHEAMIAKGFVDAHRVNRPWHSKRLRLGHPHASDSAK